MPDRQAGMGIASLALAIICFVNIGLLVAVVGATASTFQPNNQEESPFHYLIGGWILAIALLAVCGIVFGIGGLRQKHRRRSAATAGLCLNIAIPMGVMFVLLLAMTLHPLPNQTPTDHPPSPSGDATPAWRSPTARCLQLATAGMAVIAIGYSWRRRRRLNRSLPHPPSLPNQSPPGPARQMIRPPSAISGLAAALTACATCRKRIPLSSRFCRRCGHAVAAQLSI